MLSPLDDALGLTRIGVEDDAVVFRLDPTHTAFGFEDERYLHGGALATCVDTAGWAAIDAAGAGEGDWVAVDLRCDFLRIGRGSLRVVGVCRRRGRRLAVADVTISEWDDPVRLVALGRATFTRVDAGAA